MCLAVPLKLISKENNIGIGEFKGIKQRIRLDFVPDVKVDNYVMVHAGFAMQIVDSKILEEISSLFSEIRQTK